jgi:hypothetical protein
MQHVDEGILHGYLDGALPALVEARALPAGVTAADVEDHLRICDDCRALLERERALRGDAAVVLGHARLADVETPPWHVVAGGAGVARAPRSRPLLPMAWAASVLLAVGAGWWGSLLWRAELDSVATEVVADEAEPAARVPTRSEAVADATVESAGPAPVPMAAPLPVLPELSAPAVAVESQAAREMADRIAAEVGGRSVSIPPVPVGEPVMTAAARLRVDSVAALQQDAGRSFALSGTMALTNPSTPPVAQRVGSVSSAPPPVSAQRSSQVVNAPPPPAAPPARQQQRVQGEALVRVPLPVELFREAVGAARDGALHWQPRVQESLVGRLLVIAGAARIDVSSAPAPGGGELLRVTHQLADGTAVELLQWREPDASAAPRLDGPATVATVIVQAAESPAGGRELLLRVPLLGLYVLITADLDARQIVALGDALVLLR